MKKKLKPNLSVSDPKKSKHPGGRPPDYHDGMPDLLIGAMYEGKSVVRFCRDVRISRTTFYDWISRHEDFKNAYEIGKTDCEAYWEEFLVNNLMNKEVNSGLIKLFMANRFGWSDKQEAQMTHRVDESLENMRRADNEYKRDY